MMKSQNKLGFTLLELMIVVVVLGILATVSVPIYNHYVRKGYRANAIQGLLSLQLDEEKYRYSNQTYSNALPLPTVDRYAISISNVSATTYTLTATAQGDQANDAGGACAVLILTVNSGTITKAPTACWN